MIFYRLQVSGQTNLFIFSFQISHNCVNSKFFVQPSRAAKRDIFDVFVSRAQNVNENVKIVECAANLFGSTTLGSAIIDLTI
jgi:hypothetical protein